MVAEMFPLGDDQKEVVSLEDGDDVLKRELQTYEGLMRGHQECLRGDVVNADEADKKIRQAKGWVS